MGLGHRADEACAVLADLLGPQGDLDRGRAPVWRSDISDDHTPVEYSVAFEEDGSHTLRLLVEAGAAEPGRRANLDAAEAALDRLATRYPLALDKLDAVRGLFLPEDPQGLFAMWFSLVLRRSGPPMVKVYLNPQVRGAAQAERLVGAGLDRLGFAGSMDWVRAHTPRQGGGLDRFSFFALDLEDTPAARVKLYQSHHGATAADARFAAGGTAAADPHRLTRFATDLGGDGPFRGRPLVSSHTFLASDAARPRGYSLYVPIRDYVPDDGVALVRTRAALARCGVDTAALDRAVEAVATRPLVDGVGLIAHVSLRMGPPRPGVTVYLSAEAHGVAPPVRGTAAGAA
ncbi:hypothetical protein BJP25_22080 [Actinokineospora bangkokensis]|uniref:Tryptophan dimethylallyltransferase n=1 Tax=Actinokineospora bangkokensis TaxID=1193682 RepID=A0A1Q9LJV2_9PSEU|nr:hypothetical protein BJP25_22080 [Actinokineospora bangkokensis]